MAYQTKVNSDVDSMGRPKPARHGVSRLAAEIAELGELQAELFKLDARDSSLRVRNIVVVAVVGAVLLLAALIVALLAAAEALFEFAEWSRAVSLATVAGTAFVITLILFYMARNGMQKAFATWQRSREELTKNISWVKSALKGGNGAASSRTHGTYSD